MSLEDGKDFKARFEQFKIAGSFDEALKGFEQLILDYQGRYKTFMASVWLNRNNYLNFLKYPKAVQKYLYITNVSENFNPESSSGLVRMNSAACGWFLSE